MDQTELEAKAILEELAGVSRTLTELLTRAQGAIGWFKQMADGAEGKAESFRLMLSQAEHRIAVAEHRAGVAERANAELQAQVEGLTAELAKARRPTEEQLARQDIEVGLAMVARPRF